MPEKLTKIMRVAVSVDPNWLTDDGTASTDDGKPPFEAGWEYFKTRVDTFFEAQYIAPAQEMTIEFIEWEPTEVES